MKYGWTLETARASRTSDPRRLYGVRPNTYNNNWKITLIYVKSYCTNCRKPRVTGSAQRRPRSHSEGEVSSIIKITKGPSPRLPCKHNRGCRACTVTLRSNFNVFGYSVTIWRHIKISNHRIMDLSFTVPTPSSGFSTRASARLRQSVGLETSFHEQYPHKTLREHLPRFIIKTSETHFFQSFSLFTE